MTRTISLARFRLVCHEIAAKVNARKGREEPTEAAILLELLRRVESHLGRRPVVLSSSEASRASCIVDALAAVVNAGADGALSSIVHEELLGKVHTSDGASTGKGTRQTGLGSGA